MRPRQATGRPGTQVIPTGWSDAPRQIMRRTWTAAVSIRHPGGTQGPFDPDTGTYPSVPFPPHYVDGARIQVLSTQEQEQLVAEDEVTTVAYRVVVDLDTSTETRVGDVVLVDSLDTSIGDPLTVGQELVVRSYGVGSMAWERDLICTLQLPD